MKPELPVQALREQGYRLTRQRMLILDLLRQQKQHLSAEAIHEAVKPKHPKLDLATVYRTLHWLHGVGLLHKIDGKDRLEWEYATAATHHHLICNQCGAEQEISNHVMECLQAHVLEHYDFETDPEHVALFGRCAQCRSLKPNNLDKVPAQAGPRSLSVAAVDRTVCGGKDV